MSIPTLLVCDGSESRQEVLEKLIKGEPGLKYLATVGSQNGASAVDQALKIGGRLVWFDLDDEVDNVVTLMNEVKTLFPQAVMVASVTTVTPEIASIAEHIGVAALLYPQNFYEQVKALVAFLNGQGSAPGAGAAPAAAPAPAPAAAPAPAPATAVAQTPVTAGPGQEESKWGNLDSIPTPKANIKEQEATGEINVVSMRPNLDVTASANQAKQDIQAAVNTQQEGGSKWGDLDSIGSPQARATAPETQALPVAPARTPAPQPAPAPAPTPAPAPAQAATPSNGNQAESGNKWGDLDAIPTPKAVTKEVSFSPDDTPKPVAPPPPLPPPRPKGDNTLRPSPTKAEMYNMPSTPAWFIAVILLVIMACVGYVYYSRMHH